MEHTSQVKILNFLHRSAPYSKQTDIDMFQVKSSFGLVIKLLFQIPTKLSNERVPKDHYFWGTRPFLN